VDTSAGLEQLKRIVGPTGHVADEMEKERYLRDWRGLYRGVTPLVLRPSSTAQVAELMRACAGHGIAVVPQGGNTGLVGGAVPASTPTAPQVLISAERLTAIRSLDPDNLTLTAEAGCVLARLQETAAQAGLLFPLSLAAEGSCQLGGNISTNAGGLNVLRYGNMREQVLGLEVVLPDGRIWQGLRGLRKDNTGYDLKQLFIGAEGTLGFITAATCRLHPRSVSSVTALVAVGDITAAVALLQAAREGLGGELQACELISSLALDLAVQYLGVGAAPLAGAPWFVLLEAGSSRPGATLQADAEHLLAALLERGVISDGVIAQSGGQAGQLWALRHGISSAQGRIGGSIKHDISLPVSRLAAFERGAGSLLQGLVPGCRPVVFGHLGDGNLHYNVSQPPGMPAGDFLARWEEVSQQVHSLAVEMGGSFSAEHGIGLLKSGELARLRDPVEISLMRAVKRALDPAGLMNPGKLLPPEGD
jgi:FAD/FMN-containing dehydrogenase